MSDGPEGLDYLAIGFAFGGIDYRGFARGDHHSASPGEPIGFHSGDFDAEKIPIPNEMVDPGE
jgi:hypothetical protein